MASLTPLSKGLIGLAVLGAMTSAVWHLGLKERFQGGAAPAQQSGATTPAPAPMPTKPAPPAMAPAPATATAPEASKPPAAATADTNSQTKAQASNPSAAENGETGRKFLVSGNFTQARVHLEQAVQAGDGGAACLLGEMTLKGQGGIRVNQDQAAKLFQLAQSRNTICFASGQ